MEETASDKARSFGATARCSDELFVKENAAQCSNRGYVDYNFSYIVVAAPSTACGHDNPSISPQADALTAAYVA